MMAPAQTRADLGVRGAATTGYDRAGFVCLVTSRPFEEPEIYAQELREFLTLILSSVDPSARPRAGLQQGSILLHS